MVSNQLNRIRLENRSLYSFLLVSLLLLAGCCESPKKNAAVEKSTTDSSVNLNDQHNSANALDWMGTYKGTVPCADCEGVETELTINKDLTFVMKTTYLGKGDHVFEEKGGFTWNTAGNTILLQGLQNKPNQYFVGENKIWQLDLSGNRITGSLADNYILKKQ